MIQTGIEFSTGLRFMAGLMAIWTCVSSFEQLSGYSRFSDGGLVSWKVMREYFNRRFLRRLMPLFTPSGFRKVLWSRIALGVALGAAAVLDVLHPALFLALFLLDILVFYRIKIGLSGAYHMLFLLNAGMFLVTLYPEGSLVETAAMVFIAVNGILAYFVAGYLKLKSSAWRDGTGLQGILSTRTFGHKRIYELTQSWPIVAVAVSWFVILFEVVFPVVLVIDPQWTVVLFGAGMFFHLMNGVLMGLNGFSIIFPATYFPIYYVNVLLHQSFL